MSDFTMPEIRYLLAECNFTKEEEALFIARCSDVPFEECAERMNVSISTVDRINRKIKSKVKRVTNEMYQGKSSRGYRRDKN